MGVRTGVTTIAMLLAAYAGASYGADAAKGKAVADKQCAECHAAADWEGESAEALSTMMKDVKAGKVKHKTKLTLSDEDIAAVATYWSQGDK